MGKVLTNFLIARSFSLIMISAKRLYAFLKLMYLFNQDETISICLGGLVKIQCTQFKENSNASCARACKYNFWILLTKHSDFYYCTLELFYLHKIRTLLSS